MSANNGPLYKTGRFLGLSVFALGILLFIITFITLFSVIFSGQKIYRAFTGSDILDTVIWLAILCAIIAVCSTVTGKGIQLFYKPQPSPIIVSGPSAKMEKQPVQTVITPTPAPAPSAQAHVTQNIQKETPPPPPTQTEATSQKRHCLNCGVQIPLHAVHCPKCGHKQE